MIATVKLAMMLEAIKTCQGSMLGLPCGGIEVKYDIQQNSSTLTRRHSIATLRRLYDVLLNRPIKIVLSANTAMHV